MVRLYFFLVHAAILASAFWLAIDVKQSAFTVIAMFVALTGLAAWLARGTVLRALRLANGALTATMASLTTIAFSLSLTLPGGSDDDRSFTMMVMILFGAAISAWVCDWKIKAADDARALERHAELLAAVQAASPSPAIVEAPRSKTGAVFTLAAFAMMWRRSR